MMCYSLHTVSSAGSDCDRTFVYGESSYLAAGQTISTKSINML